MNNKHQELIAEKVAGLKQNHCYAKIDPLEYEYFFLKSASAHNTKLLFADIEKTLQDTINKVLEEERERIVNTFKSMQTRYPEFSLDLELFEGEIMFNTSRPF